MAMKLHLQIQLGITYYYHTQLIGIKILYKNESLELF